MPILPDMSTARTWSTFRPGRSPVKVKTGSSFAWATQFESPDLRVSHWALRPPGRAGSEGSKFASVSGLTAVGSSTSTVESTPTTAGTSAKPLTGWKAVCSSSVGAGGAFVSSSVTSPTTVAAPATTTTPGRSSVR